MPVYHVRSDVDLIYGKENVTKWADLNNNGNEEEIAARVTWASELSYEYTNANLADGPYDVPFEVDPDTHVIIKDLSARWTGWILYESRGFVDAEDSNENQLKSHKQFVMDSISDIHGGNIKLIGLDRQVTFPKVVE